MDDNPTSSEHAYAHHTDHYPVSPDVKLEQPVGKQRGKSVIIKVCIPSILEMTRQLKAQGFCTAILFYEDKKEEVNFSRPLFARFRPGERVAFFHAEVREESIEIGERAHAA